jgi:hypothetical protein
VILTFPNQTDILMHLWRGAATGAELTQLNSDIAQQQATTQGDVNGFKVWPVVSLGLAIHI